MKLLDEVLAAYGGLERWKELHTIKIHQIVGGVLWPLKNVDGVINDSTVEIRVQNSAPGTVRSPSRDCGRRIPLAASLSRPMTMQPRPSKP